MLGTIKKLDDAYVYKTVNSINGKFYIGKCERSPESSESYYGSGKVLQLAMSKYGKDKFTKTILVRGIRNSMELELAEMSEINAHDAISLGYNLASGGEGGFIGHTIWTHEKMDMMREAHWGKYDIGNITYEDIYGDRASIIKAKQSASHALYNASEKGIADKQKRELAMTGSGNHFYGKTHSAEARAKISAANKARGLERNIEIGVINGLKSKTPEALEKFKTSRMTRYTISMLDGSVHKDLTLSKAIKLLNIGRQRFNTAINNNWDPTSLPGVRKLIKYIKGGTI